MAYTRTVWSTGDLITALLANNWELGIERTHARSMTEGVRNGLAGDDLFAGRMIWNTTTERVEVWDGARWLAPAERAARLMGMGV